MAYVLDTNFIVDVVCRKPQLVERFNEAVSKRTYMAIPRIVEYEVLRGFVHRPSSHKEAIYRYMRTKCSVVDTNAAAWKRAAYIWAGLRKAGITIGDADILIAAYCIENGFILVTHNTKHFSNIPGIQLEDWT